jgi:flagellar basal body-associated protein FliL
VALKRFLMAVLLVVSIAAAAVLLFMAGDHDEEDRNSAQAPSSSQSFELGRYPCSQVAIAAPISCGASS